MGERFGAADDFFGNVLSPRGHRDRHHDGAGSLVVRFVPETDVAAFEQRRGDIKRGLPKTLARRERDLGKRSSSGESWLAHPKRPNR